MNQITNERRGATSASNAQADLLCPGRHLAQKGIPEPAASKDAEFGRIIHSALATNGRDGQSEILNRLTGEQRDIFDACREIEKKVIAQFFSGDTAPQRVFREQRYWCMVDKKWEHSGQPDVVVRSGSKGLILDYKTLPSDQPESPANLQLRDYVVLASRSLFLSEVGCAVVQPLVTYEPTVTLYNPEAITRAEQDMWERVRKSNDPASPRIPGEVQCKFCLARAICKEYAGWAPRLLPAPITPLGVPVALWTPEQRAAFCDRRGSAAKWLEECEQQLKKLLSEDPNAIPGWCLKDGQFRDTITDPQQLFERFTALGGTLEQYMACVKITKGELGEQVREVSGLKGKALKLKLEELLAGLVESKQTAPSLERKK